MASALGFLLPAKDTPGRFYGEMVILGTLVVAKPAQAKSILAVESIIIKDSVAANVLKCQWISAIVAADGQSVTFYGWKTTAVNDVTPLASTADVSFTFTMLCEMV